MGNPEQDEHFQKAKTVVNRLLNFRPRSEQELREKLATKKFPHPVVEQTVRRYKDLNLVDDRQFARQWISSRLKKPFGLNRIRIELKKKGIHAAVIRDAVAEILQDYDELRTVQELARRRLDQCKNIEPELARRRLYGYLQRRGFNTETIIKVITAL